MKMYLWYNLYTKPWVFSVFYLLVMHKTVNTWHVLINIVNKTQVCLNSVLRLPFIRSDFHHLMWKQEYWLYAQHMCASDFQQQ